ncbi:hypothetical protein ACGVWS_11840 [Enterobacteriaceae bacterium LUAb1]
MHLQNQVPGFATRRMYRDQMTRRERVFLWLHPSYIPMVAQAGEPKGSPVGTPVLQTLFGLPP